LHCIVLSGIAGHSGTQIKDWNLKEIEIRVNLLDEHITGTSDSEVDSKFSHD
jgi:hypothetical protein